MLSEERIIELAGLAPNRKVCASTCMTRKFDKKPCECYPEMRTTEALEFSRAIEAEVRKQDTELIQQMLYVIEAWERGCEYDDYWRDRDDCITTARKRLRNT